MKKHCGNCAVYDRKNLKHSKLCGKCVTEHFSNGEESDPSMWKPLPQTNADRIRAMTDEQLAGFLASIHYYEPVWDKWFGKKFCDKCVPHDGRTAEGKLIEIYECEFSDGECPHGDSVLLWLQESAEETYGE